MKAPLIVVSSILLILVGIEIALRSIDRSIDRPADRKPPLAPNASHSIDRKTEAKGRHIVFVSDSVFGPAENTQTPAGQMFLKIKKEIGQPVRFTDISRPGLVSQQALSALNELLEKDPADTLVMMIGKSDYLVTVIQDKLERLSMGWLSRLEISRVAMIWLLEVEQDSQRRRFAPDLIERRKALEPAWNHYSTMSVEGIAEFEKVILLHPDQERPIRALLHLYLTHNRHEQGIAYFSELEKVSKNKELVRLMRASLEYELDAKDGTTSPETIENWKNMIDQTSNRRYAFLSALRLYKRIGDREKFGQVLISMSPEESDSFRLSAFKSYQQILDLALAKGMRVMFINYPANHHAIIDRALIRYNAVVDFVDARGILIESTKPENLIDLYETDIEHLTLDGAKSLGTGLAQRFLQENPKP